MKKLLVIGGLVGLIFLGGKWLGPPQAKPGAFLKTEPEQKFALPMPVWRGDFTIYPMANFQVDARVLGRKLYSGDAEAELSPVDLALGWGPWADEGIANRISVSQEGRFYNWHCEVLPIPAQEISRSSANMHIIPASPEVEKFVRTVEPGQKISLKGQLVSVHGPDNWSWSSSLTRNDTGDGACEVFYVRSAQKIVHAAEVRPPGTPVLEIVKPATRPPTPKTQDVILKTTRTFQIPYGKLTIPAGDAVRIDAEKGSKIKATYRGFEIWMERDELE